ncbi:MAG TPA: DUF6174 domain-containing protein [Gemmatimonadaceae bacterium]|nr:DUF6174 domain-containing protein [Gemmatimonadaceae bacterium]
MTNRAVRVAVCALTCLASACDSTTEPIPLAAHRAQWEAQNLQDYNYSGRMSSFWHDTGEVSVTVTADEVSSVRLVSTGEPQDPEDWKTIPRLFDQIEQLSQDRTLRVNVAFDPTLGYPTNMFVGCRGEVLDCGLTLVISDLVPDSP